MTEDRDIDVTYDLSGFVAELRRLADALENGADFTIQVDGEDVTIPEGAQFSIAHEREDGQVELEFQVTWSLAGEEDAAEADDAMAEADAEPAASQTEG